MREIKFRAWEERSKAMLPSDYVGKAMEDGGFSFNQSDLIFMQFTGLHDKNGKGIYEGDIVKYHTPDGQVKEVKFPDCYDSDSHESIYSSDHWVIIGNIYENPELINTK